MTLSTSCWIYCLFAPVTNISISYLKGLITFVGSPSRNVVNLSRIDPAHLLLTPAAGKWKTQYIVYKNNQKPALCFMIGLAVNDSTRTPLSFNNKGQTFWQKSISIVPITLEIERQISTICTILNVNEYWSQFEDNALKFATVPGSSKDNSELYVIRSRILKTCIFAGKSGSSEYTSPKRAHNQFYNKLVSKAAVGNFSSNAVGIYSSSVLSVHDEGNL